MNGRRLFREYAQSKGLDAKEFVKIIPEWYEQDTLVTKNTKGELESITISYKDMVHWIIAKYPNSKGGVDIEEDKK